MKSTRLQPESPTYLTARSHRLQHLQSGAGQVKASGRRARCGPCRPSGHHLTFVPVPEPCHTRRVEKCQRRLSSGSKHNLTVTNKLTAHHLVRKNQARLIVHYLQPSRRPPLPPIHPPSATLQSRQRLVLQVLVPQILSNSVPMYDLLLAGLVVVRVASSFALVHFPQWLALLQPLGLRMTVPLFSRV